MEIIGSGPKDLLQCRNHFMSKSKSQDSLRSADCRDFTRPNPPPSGIPPGSSGPNSVSESAHPQSLSDSTAPNIQPPLFSFSSSSLPLTRALLVSNLVSILQTSGSQVRLADTAAPGCGCLPKASTSATRGRGSRKLLNSNFRSLARWATETAPAEA